MESGKNSQKTECPCPGHQRAGKENLILTASNYSDLFNKVYYRGETDFYFFTQVFVPMCPETFISILLFVPRNLKFYHEQSYI